MIEFNAQKSEQEKIFGLDRVEFHGKGFVVAMRKIAIDIAKKNGTVTCDDLRRVAQENDLQPHHPGAWGAIFTPKYFKHCGWKKTEVVTSHARPIVIWRYEQIV